MPEQPLSCRSEEGITTGLVDALIAIIRVLALRDMKANETQAALTDLFEDPDFRMIQEARQIN